MMPVIVRRYMPFWPMPVVVRIVCERSLRVMRIVVPMIDMHSMHVVDGWMPMLMAHDGAQIVAASIDFLAPVAVCIEVPTPPSV